MRLFAFTILTIAYCYNANAQDRITIPDLCIHDNSSKIEPINIVSDESSASRRDASSVEIVQQILKFVGARRKIEIISESGRGNACATITKNQKRIIFIDDAWLRSVTNNEYWLRFFILAHEIGHHINNHSIGFEGRNAYQNEIDADYFAGRMLNIAGAKLDIVEEYFEECPFEETANHPPCFLRIASVKEGYGDTPANTPSIENPRASITEKNSRIQKVDLRVECRKNSDRGCTAHDVRDFTAPNGMLIYSDGTLIESQNGSGRKGHCNLEFNNPTDVDFVEADTMFKTLRLTAHAESGSGFDSLGKVAYRDCRVSAVLVQQ